MTLSEVLQLILSILSLIATVSISIIIYKAEKRQAKKDAQEKENARLKELENEAEIFIIKNGDDIDYLPLCVFANSLNKFKKHKRTIYNNFNMCSSELQQIILKKKNLCLLEISSSDWFFKAIDDFEKDINEFNLGRNLYYDNAKYITRCFDYYSGDKIPNVDTEIFEVQDYNFRKNPLIIRDVYKCGLYFYIGRWFDFCNDIKKDKALKEIQMISPCDYVYRLFSGENEKIYCYWNAQLLRYLCSHLRNYKPNTYDYVSPSYSPAIELNVDCFEDLYYCALYELYLTYCNDKTKESL